MILCNNFSSSAIIQNKVFYIIQQIIRFTESGNKIFQACTAFFNCFSVGIFLLTFYLKPFKEKLISCRKTPQAGFHPVGQHANLIIMEQVWNILQVIFQVDVIGILHRDITVFQLNEYHRKTIDKNNQIRPVPVRFSLYPHLGCNRKVIVQGILITQQMKNIGSLFAVLFVLNGNSVAKLLIIPIIDQHQIAGNWCTAQLIRGSVNRFRRNIRVDSAETFKHHIRQHHLPFITAPGPVRKLIRILCHTVQNSIFVPLMQIFHSRLFNHIFCYDFWHGITSFFLCAIYFTKLATFNKNLLNLLHLKAASNPSGLSISLSL